jgi:uncharacterized repeat protein (TIGR01451 family)
MTPNGALGYCVLDTNLIVNQCGQYIDPDKVDRVFVKIGIVAPAGGYTRTAIYHEPTTGKNKYDCGATGSEPGADPENNGKSFKDGDVIEFWRPVGRDSCGRDQWDGDIRDGTNRLDFLGFVLNYPTNCRTCEVAGLQLSKTQAVSGDNELVTIRADWEKVNGDKASLYEGATLIQTINAPGAFSQLTLPRDGKTRTYRVVLENGDLRCEQTITVTTGENDDCEDVAVQFSFATIVESSGVTPTYQKCFKGSWVNPGTGTLDFGDTTSQPVNNPFNSECHGYTQGDEAKDYTATLTVVRGQLHCPKTLTVKVPPRNKECTDYTKPVFGGELALTGQTSTQVTVTPGTVTPAGGSFNPTLPSLQPRPPAGSGDATFSTDYTVPYGPAELKCTAEHEYSIKIPQQDEKKECKLTLSKDVDKSEAKDGDYLKYSLTVSNEGTGNCTGGGVKVEDHTPDNVDYSSSSGTVGQCHWQGPIEWNCGTMAPGTSITVWWKGKVDNPNNNCNDFVIKNKASGWSAEKGTIWSNEVSTTVDIDCGPTCPPNSTTTNVNWTNLLESQYGNNPRCSDFGLSSLEKKEFGNNVEQWNTSRSASILIVKDGKCDANPDYYAKKVSPQDSSKWIASGLQVKFNCGGSYKDLSHVEMCGCPVAGAQAVGDPYYWDGSIE